MITEARFNKLLTSLEKVAVKNGGYHDNQITEDRLAVEVVELGNKWLDEGKLIEIVDNRLRLTEAKTDDHR